MTADPATPAPVVIHAADTDRDALVGVIAEAFHNLEVSQWLIPGPGARAEVFPGYFRIHVEHALDQGTVLTTAARDAVALWLPVPKNGTRDPRDYQARLAAATGPHLRRFQALDTAFEQAHPVGVVHQHLEMIAVRPGRQRTGIGSALLNHHHEILDRAGIPAYLEASGLDTRRIYIRHGYYDCPHRTIELPDGGPCLHPMWRDPQPQAGM